MGPFEHITGRLTMKGPLSSERQLVTSIFGLRWPDTTVGGAGMKLGLVHVSMGSLSQPDALVRAAQAAEAAGFDSVWACEHVVLPDPQAPPSPMRPQDPALDPLLALAWAAAHTSAVRLAT